MKLNKILTILVLNFSNIFIHISASEMSQQEKVEYRYNLILNQDIDQVCKYLNNAKGYATSFNLIHVFDNIINKIKSKKINELSEALADLYAIKSHELVNREIHYAKNLLSKIIISVNKPKLLCDTISQQCPKINFPPVLSRIILDYTGEEYQEVLNLGQVIHYDYSPDGKYIVVSYRESSDGKQGVFHGGVKIFDIDANKYIKTLEGTYNTIFKENVDNVRNSKDGIHDIAWSPNGSYIAACCKSVILVWNVNTGRIIKRYIDKFSDHFTKLCWTSDSSIIIGSSYRLFICNFNNDKTSIISCAITPNSMSLFQNMMAISNNCHAQIIDLSESKITNEIDIKEVYAHIAWSKNGILAISDNDRIKLYKCIDGSLQEILCINPNESVNFEDCISSLDFYPDGLKLLSAGYEFESKDFSPYNIKWQIKIWCCKTGKILDTIDMASNVKDVRWSPCGNYISLINGLTLRILGKTLE